MNFVSFLLFFSSVFAEHHILNWTVFWTVQQPDGYPRPVISIRESNRAIAYDDIQNQSLFGGPTVRVHTGDSVAISVTNALLDTIISIHFHGLHMLHQVSMDGVVGITQNGILPRSTFVYNFNITQNPGTFFYHSHSGLQSSDGFQGMFIIDPPNQQHIQQTKKTMEIVGDFIVPIQDWNHELSSTLYVKYTSRNGAFPNFKADYPYPATSILIQGKGQFDCEEKNFYTEESCDIIRKYGWLYFLNDQNTSFALPEPTDPYRTNGQCNPSRPPFVGPCATTQDKAVFMCEFGKTIRMRFVGAGFSLGLRIWIDQHAFLIIAKDGFDVHPIAVEAIFLHAGERIDAYVECNQTAMNYTLFVAVAYEYYGKHAHLKSPNVSSFAQLAYVDANETSEIKTKPEDWPKQNIDPVFFYNSDYNSGPAQERFVIFSQSKGHWWNFEQNVQGKRLEWWEMNTSTPFTIPNGESLLTRCLRNMTTFESMFVTSAPLIVRLVYNQKNPIVYEFFLVNNESQPHPWHIHGYSVDVLRVGHLNDFIENKNLISQNTTVLNVMRADTFVVPSKSYVQFRLTANNPGPWIVHCHMPYHSEVGMAFLISVEYDGKECKYQEIEEKTTDVISEHEQKVFYIACTVLFGITFLWAVVLCSMWIKRRAANNQRKVRPLNDTYVQDLALTENFKPNDQLDNALAAITPPEKSCGCC